MKHYLEPIPECDGMLPYKSKRVCRHGEAPVPDGTAYSILSRLAMPLNALHFRM